MSNFYQLVPLPPFGQAKNRPVQLSLSNLVDQLNNKNSAADNWDNVYIGTASTTTGVLRMFNASSSHYISFSAGNNSADASYILPTALPAGTYVLQSTSLGVMSWLDVASTYAPIGSAYVTIGNDGTLTAERALTGTSNQVIVTDNGANSSVVLSTPQNIHTGATPTFSTLTLGATSLHLILTTASHNLTIQANSQASARTWSVPDISGNGTFAALEGTQTFSGSKTFSAQVISSATSNHLKLATSSNNAIISVATIATADRTITIPDPGTNANFVLTESAQTINGVKTFGTDTVFDGDVYSTTYNDYASTSTVTGWSSRSTTHIYYKKVGKLTFVWFFIEGTSNSTSTSFTLPTASANTMELYFGIEAFDNGSLVASPVGHLAPNNTTVSFFKDMNSTTWTNSGGKDIYGQFVYQTV